MDKIKSIWNKINNRNYYRYYAAVVIFVVIILLLAFCTAGDNNSKVDSSDPMSGAYQDFTNETETKDSKKSSVTTEDGETKTVQQLIEEYYGYYAAGDTASLQTIADPISERELSYIEFFSQYVEEYQDIVVYTKGGLDENSYLVSVSMKVKFVNIDTAAAGLDFFYVSTNDSGNLYINNLYSSYNSNNGEYDMDPDITALITTFEQQDDLVALQQEVQADFEAALASDEALSTFLTTTLSEATTTWRTDYEAMLAQREIDAANATTVYVTADVTVKDSASAEGADLGVISAGSAVTKYAEENTYTRVDYNGGNGYIETAYISTEPVVVETTETAEGTETEETTETDGDTVSVDGVAAGDVIEMTDTVKIREEQTTDSSVVDTAYMYETVTVIENYSSGWTKVKSVRGNEGYMKTEFLQ